MVGRDLFATNVKPFQDVFTERAQSLGNAIVCLDGVVFSVIKVNYSHLFPSAIFVQNYLSHFSPKLLNQHTCI